MLQWKRSFPSEMNSLMPPEETNPTSRVLIDHRGLTVKSIIQTNKARSHLTALVGSAQFLLTHLNIIHSISLFMVLDGAKLEQFMGKAVTELGAAMGAILIFVGD